MSFVPPCLPGCSSSAAAARASRSSAARLPATSPLTGEPLGNEVLIPNVALRGLILDLLDRRPELLTAGQTGAAFANL